MAMLACACKCETLKSLYSHALLIRGELSKLKKLSGACQIISGG